MKKILRLIQLLLLLPSTLYLGTMALIVSGGLYPWWGSRNSLFLLIPVLGFILLWILIIKGAAWVAMRSKLAFMTLLLGIILCVVGSDVVFRNPKEDNDSAALVLSALFLIPVIIGGINLLILGKNMYDKYFSIERK